MARRKIADIFLKLREQALSFGEVEIKAAPVVPGGRALGVIIDLGYDTAIVSVMGLADGTTSMYVSNGGGKIGMGDHSSVALASKRWVEVAETASPVTETDGDELPMDGTVRFNILDRPGLFAEARESELGFDTHPLHRLYAAGQAVITAMRLVDEAGPG